MCCAAACASALALEVDDQSRARVLAAELALDGGNCRDAAERYAGAAAKSRDPRLLRRATEVGVACEHLPAAWESSQRWRAIDPENVDALRAAGLVALGLYRLGDARAIFGELLRKPDVEPDRALQELLPQLLSGDDINAAWATMNTVVDRDAIDQPIMLQLADLAVAADDLGGAKALADRVLAKSPESAKALQLGARLRAADGNATEGLEMARRAAGSPGDEPEAAFAVAEVLIDLDRNEEAHRELERLAQLPATSEEADRRLALLALATGDFDEARRRFGERLQRSAGAAEAFFYLGTIAERSGDDELALQTYQRLVAAGAGLLPRSRAASLLVRTGKREEALALLDDYLKRNPQQVIDVVVARAELLLQAGAAREAVAEVDAALRRYPQHPQLEYHRAMVFERAARHRDSIQAFERLLKRRPDDPTVLNALGYTLGDRRQQLPRAEALIRRALLAMPDNAPAIDSLAWVLYRQGNARDALPLFERAYHLSRDSEIAAHWGEVLWVSGRQAEARTVWARALARTPNSQAVREAIARFAPAANSDQK